MLALRSLSAGTTRRGTLIFDEVDAGIGGRAADDVGRKLQRLGQGTQVLCITHLPQIAACGATHFQVTQTGHRRPHRHLCHPPRQEPRAKRSWPA